MKFSYVLFLLHLDCCTDYMTIYRTGVSAVCRLPVSQRLAHAAFTHCIILSLCQLLKLNDGDILQQTFYK